jgi:hypothetical protein
VEFAQHTLSKFVPSPKRETKHKAADWYQNRHTTKKKGKRREGNNACLCIRERNVDVNVQPARSKNGGVNRVYIRGSCRYDSILGKETEKVRKTSASKCRRSDMYILAMIKTLAEPLESRRLRMIPSISIT